MALAKEQIQQIISENNINSVTDIYTLLKDSFKDNPAEADGGRTGCNSWIREKP